AARARAPRRADGRAAGALADLALLERGALDRGRSVRPGQGPLRRRLLLQPVLGRLARGVPPLRAPRRAGGTAGLQAHARRARPRRRGVAARAPDPPRPRRGPPADRAPDAPRRADRAG